MAQNTTDSLLDDEIPEDITLREVAVLLYRHMKREEEQLAALVQAFPEGDTVGHRRYHDLLIKREEQRDRVRQAVIEKTLAGLVWFAIVGIAVAAWQTFKHALGVPP